MIVGNYFFQILVDIVLQVNFELALVVEQNKVLNNLKNRVLLLFPYLFSELLEQNPSLLRNRVGKEDFLLQNRSQNVLKLAVKQQHVAVFKLRVPQKVIQTSLNGSCYVWHLLEELVGDILHTY